MNASFLNTRGKRIFLLRSTPFVHATVKCRPMEMKAIGTAATAWIPVPLIGTKATLDWHSSSASTYQRRIKFSWSAVGMQVICQLTMHYIKSVGDSRAIGFHNILYMA